MRGLLVFLPVAIGDIVRRLALLNETYRSLERSLLAAKSVLPSRVHLLLHLNGILERRSPEGSAAEIVATQTAFAAAKAVASGNFGKARVTWDPTPGKSRAINFALQEARRLGCNLLLCVDDDLVVPPSAVCDVLDAAAAHAHLHAFTAYKAPLLSPQDTPFQRLYSFAFTTSFLHDIYPKRATGSFYCLNVSRIEDFPALCNEGDVLERLPHASTGVVVRSPFPPTREEEVARRMRLEVASRAAGYARLHHDPAFLDDIDRRFRLPDAVDKRRYRRALALSRGIVAETLERLGGQQ